MGPDKAGQETVPLPRGFASMALYFSGMSDNDATQVNMANSREHEGTRERVSNCETTVAKVTENLKLAQNACDSRFSTIEASVEALREDTRTQIANIVATSAEGSSAPRMFSYLNVDGERIDKV